MIAELAGWLADLSFRLKLHSENSTIKKSSKSRKFLYIRPWTFLSRVVAERIPRITISREVYLNIISYEDWARHYQLTFWWRRDAADVHENPSTPELLRGSSFTFSMPKQLQHMAECRDCRLFRHRPSALSMG
jgi:hypothetical protein